MQYRKDIDGLRALAVLPVVTFHAGFSQTPGGFVGVDVFFVISGFLICGIIQRDLDKHRFSLANFYERRARRILPALFFVLAASGLAGLATLAPSEVERLGSALAAATLSVSNIYFAWTLDYFAAENGAYPLLHTWSLGVEEQFYIVIPLIMMLIHRAGSQRWLVPSFVAIALLSLAVAILETARAPQQAFFMLHTRAWELALGALVALMRMPGLQTRLTRELLAAGGLIAILLAVFLFSEHTPFPGVAALLPTLGAAAILYTGSQGDTFVRSLLSWRPVVFVGLISYSLYLWHWPVIVFSRASLAIGDGWDPKLEKLALVALSFLLAILTWRFVERPFRNRDWLTRKGIFRLSGVGAAVLGLTAAAFVASEGLPGRMAPETARLVSVLEEDPRRTLRAPGCMVGDTLVASLDARACLSRDPARPDILLLGDSHAGHLWAGLARALPNHNLMQATAGGCRPFLWTPSSDPICQRFRSMITDRIERTPPDAVLVAARWDPADLERVPELLSRVRDLNIPVILIGPSPRYTQPLPRLLMIAEQRGDAQLPGRQMLDGLTGIDRTLARHAATAGAHHVSLLDVLCAKSRQCAHTDAKGLPIQYDSGHFTLGGSVAVGVRAGPAVRAALRSAIKSGQSGESSDPS